MSVTVSVVIPTRNRVDRVVTAISSALAQTHPGLEVVVVDDASEDDTPDVLSRLGYENDRVRIMRLEERCGAPRARNTGVRHAQGDLVAFLDDDSWWHPDKIEKQLASMTTRHRVCYTSQATRDVDGRWIIEGRPIRTPSPVDALLRTNFIGSPSLVVDRRLFREVGGFDEELPRLQDWDLALRLGRHTAFSFVSEVLVHSIMIPGGISTAAQSLPEAAARMVERHTPHLTRFQTAALHYGLGKFLLVDGHTSVARDFFRSSIRLDPGSVHNWAGFAGGLLGPVPARLIHSFRRRLGALIHGDVQARDFHPRPSADQ